jgi:hypothetical protein
VTFGEVTKMLERRLESVRREEIEQKDDLGLVQNVSESRTKLAKV